MKWFSLAYRTIRGNDKNYALDGIENCLKLKENEDRKSIFVCARVMTLSVWLWPVCHTACFSGTVDRRWCIQSVGIWCSPNLFLCDWCIVASKRFTSWRFVAGSNPLIVRQISRLTHLVRCLLLEKNLVRYMINKLTKQKDKERNRHFAQPNDKVIISIYMLGISAQAEVGIV